jgi:flagellar biosynthesis protein
MADERKKPLEAVALRYQPGEDPAPKLTAKGRGRIAERILELARQHNIPIRQDRNLVQVLSLLKLDEEIPPSVYRAVAEILAFVYRLGNRGPQVS